MASELSKKIVSAVLTADADQLASEVAVDAELSEVRYFVTAIHNKYESGEEFTASTIDWLGQRARVIYLKLKTD